MIVLGLTGSVGMGKSTTAQMFRDAGVPVFDADATVHALYEGDAVEPVARVFPGVVREGRIDRSLLRTRVVDDPAAMTRLEEIVHPLVAARRETFLAEAREAGAAVVVLDIPLLFETGADRMVDRIVVVSAPEAVQKARVLARPGMTEGAFSAILCRQVPDQDKRRRADHVIDTGQDLAATRRQVAAILDSLRGARNPIADA